MIQIDESILASAARTYLVANSRSYLARRLKEDASVISFANSHAGDKIFAALELSLASKPGDLFNLVKPYFLVAALSAKGRPDLLRRAGELPSAGEAGFLEFLQKFLVDVRTTNASNVSLPKSIGISSSTQAANLSQTINVARVQ